MTRAQQDRIMAVVVALAAVAVVVVALVTIHRRGDFEDACAAARPHGGVVVKASHGRRVCIDRDAVIEVRR